jgi:hypothetical protein
MSPRGAYSRYVAALDCGPGDAKPIDLWDAWLFAEAEASLTLKGWFTALSEDKAKAHLAYRTALDREDQAARALAARITLWLAEHDRLAAAAVNDPRQPPPAA